MTKAEATDIFRDLSSDRYSENEKAVAIYEVVTALNHSRVTKQELIDALNWLWHQHYKWK